MVWAVSNVHDVLAFLLLWAKHKTLLAPCTSTHAGHTGTRPHSPDWPHTL